MRLPRTRGSADDVDREHWWLTRIAPSLPAAVPAPLGRGVPAGGFPWPWSVYGRLSGENPVSGRLAGPTAFAGDLAEFVAALHRVAPSGAVRLPAPVRGRAGVQQPQPALRARLLPRRAALREGRRRPRRDRGPGRAGRDRRRGRGGRSVGGIAARPRVERSARLGPRGSSARGICCPSGDGSAPSSASAVRARVSPRST
ncbi:phosphotransferase [Streptomyces sp. NPDC087659]|uniref:phosphotransferase n=1 Tax=Streptomyces sp. NPDC087659 TaxID=3365801 RepID=UPI003805E76C